MDNTLDNFKNIMRQQTKTVSATDMKNKFGQIIGQMKNGTIDEVIVENRGTPLVAIVQISDFEELKKSKEKARQKEAFALLQSARAEVQRKLKKAIPDEEVDQIAENFSQQLIKNLAKKKIVRFERDAA